MSKYNAYQEIFDSHQNFFERYIKQCDCEKIDIEFPKWRPSYINYVADVKKYLYNYIFVNIVSR